MDSVLHFITTNAAHAHWWFFALLMLAGFNLPISEDLVIISSGVMAATIVPQNLVKLFVFVFLGCYLSDWVSYWMGRSLTPWLRKKKILAKLVDRKRIDKVNQFYAKYGVMTLFFGRFIPFGVRNFLFMSAGMGKMSFRKFILVDGAACLLSNATLFAVAFSLAENYPLLMSLLRKINLTFFGAFLLFLAFIFIYRYRKLKNKKIDNP